VAQHLDHQVGPDVAAANDRSLDLLAHGLPCCAPLIRA
jgi:hypothetical protein